MSRFLGFFAVFAALWALQLYATYQQSIVFMREVNRMRRGGETAIGTSGMSRFRRRTLVALTADRDDRIVEAIELSGLTVFARPQPVAELTGRVLRDLADDPTDDRRARAAAMAARTLLGEAPDGA